MDTNTNNILEAPLNIDGYLALRKNSQQQRPDLLLRDDQEPYDDYYTSKLEQQILPGESELLFKTHSTTLGSDVGSLNQKQTGKEATAKYREKRKKYVQDLEDDVKRLQKEISKVETQIKTVKDCILTKLETKTKVVHSTENAEIFNQLENCLNKNNQDESLVDIDKVNLLLNTLKYRIGPSGRERQAKIQYNFKNIVNTWFPGLHRYLLVCANQKLDIFKRQEKSSLPWTQQLLQKVNFSDEQFSKIRDNEEKLSEMYASTLEKIQKLQNIKQRMKEEALLVDTAEDQIRQHMTAVQCARWTIFCQKYKYRKDISLDGKFKPKTKANSVQSEMEKLLQAKLGRRRKRVHVDRK